VGNVLEFKRWVDQCCRDGKTNLDCTNLQIAQVLSEKLHEYLVSALIEQSESRKIERTKVEALPEKGGVP
jgi:hypothetical protein